jgi:hypothetical protein
VPKSGISEALKTTYRENLADVIELNVLIVVAICSLLGLNVTVCMHN